MPILLGTDLNGVGHVRAGQTFVEDCEVCCYPIEVQYAVQDGAVPDFEAKVLRVNPASLGTPIAPAPDADQRV